MSNQTSNKENRFTEWAVEYDNTVGKTRRHRALLDLVVNSADVKNNDRVLDIGCGTGLLSLKFLEKADCLIHGIDISHEMLQVFKDKIAKFNFVEKIHCEPKDIEDFYVEGNFFDIIASTITLHHIRDKYPIIRKIYRLLKPEGKLIIGDIDVDTTGDLCDPNRLIRIIDCLKEEYILSLKEDGIEAFSRIYDNGKKHILNDGEYCISFRQWEEFCEKAGFGKITIKPLSEFKWYKVLVAVK
ncbi:MAG: class I SAM-dependent methyltransferase [Candidatus Hodarchaeota archaeon]